MSLSSRGQRPGLCQCWSCCDTTVCGSVRQSRRVIGTPGLATFGRHAGPGRSGSLGGLSLGTPTLHLALHHRHRSLRPALWARTSDCGDWSDAGRPAPYTSESTAPSTRQASGHCRVTAVAAGWSGPGSGTGRTGPMGCGVASLAHGTGRRAQC